MQWRARLARATPKFSRMMLVKSRVCGSTTVDRADAARNQKHRPLPENQLCVVSPLSAELSPRCEQQKRARDSGLQRRRPAGARLAFVLRVQTRTPSLDRDFGVSFFAQVRLGAADCAS